MKKMIMKKLDNWADNKTQQEFDNIMVWAIGLPGSAIAMLILSIQF